MRTAISFAMLTVFTGPLVPLVGDDDICLMIDYTHDRVQTTLDPGLKRIGSIKPRGAREVGRSNLAIGCEMPDRDYGNFEILKDIPVYDASALITDRNVVIY